MEIVRTGLELAKYVFEVHGVDAEEKVILRRTLRRDAVASYFAGLPACVVGMEACSGARYWARVLSDPGHEIRLISPQFATPHVKSNKSDRNDAEARLARLSVVRRCGSCRQSRRISWRCRRCIASVSASSPTERDW